MIYQLKIDKMDPSVLNHKICSVCVYLYTGIESLRVILRVTPRTSHTVRFTKNAHLFFSCKNGKDVQLTIKTVWMFSIHFFFHVTLRMFYGDTDYFLQMANPSPRSYFNHGILFEYFFSEFCTYLNPN